ncbi:MAG TPA: nuclease-related domain-containing protein, partial [Gemmataceae bacterium]|nr:nuclease-related domain-containing protein [Gemmataceae bacterium]
MSLTDRLHTWQAARREAPTSEDPAILYGREAELFLHELVTTHFDHKGAHLFAGRRVPCPAKRMRREIDLIVLTPRMISLIEVKSWSGELIDRGAVWVQVRRGGDELHHPNLIADNLEKRAAFLDHLRRHGLGQERDFAARFVSQKIVFTNPNLTLSPSIRNHPDVITRDKLAGFLDRQPGAGFARRVFCSVVEFCLGNEAAQGVTGSIGAERFAAIVKCVAEIRTWDRLRLYGGKVLTGDLLQLHVAGRHLPREEIARGAMRVSWSRGKWGLLKALTGVGAVGRLTLPAGGAWELTGRDGVIFHAVGEPAQATVS